MNVKTARYIREIIGFNPNEEREYKEEHPLNSKGRPNKKAIVVTSTGKRKEYQLLKKYFKGEDVVLPFHLQKLLGIEEVENG